MYCTNCGASLIGTEKFCTNCGARIELHEKQMKQDNSSNMNCFGVFVLGNFGLDQCHFPHGFFLVSKNMDSKE